MNQEFARETQVGSLNLNISHIPFSELPGQSRIFLDHLDDPTSLRRYFPNAFADPGDLAKFAKTSLNEYKGNREELCDALLEINVEAGVGSTAIENIERLRRSDTVAVVTGQQAGLFSGPLYTIYKALSAIKLAEELSASGTEAVPVFWAATEDHDLAEVSETFFIGSGSSLLAAIFDRTGVREDIQVGDVVLDDRINETISTLIAQLPKDENAVEIENLLRDAWRPGIAFGKAFIATLAGIFKKYGLIFLDPMQKDLRRLAAPILKNAANAADDIEKALHKRSNDLETEGYHSQVAIADGYFPLFYIADDGRRLAIRRTSEGSRFLVKGTRTEFSLDELKAAIDLSPDKFSPAVMLRPVVQDHLLPTVCYFGGAAEVAYFAQNSVVYEILQRPVAPIMHRQSFTLIGPRQGRTLDRLEMTLVDLFDDSDEAKMKLAVEKVAPETGKLFAEVEEKVNAELNRLDQAIGETDTTLLDSLAKRRKKIIYHIAALRKKTLLAQLRNDEVAGRRMDDLKVHLLPNGALQERSINFLSFYAQYGSNLIDWLYSAVDLKDKQHRIIEL